MKILPFLLLLFGLLACQKDEQGEINIIRSTIHSQFCVFDKTIHKLEKEVERQGGKNFEEILNIALKLRQIRLKAFEHIDDSVKVKSLEGIKLYKLEILKFIQTEPILKNFTKNIPYESYYQEATREEKDELKIWVRLLEFTRLENEILDFLMSQFCVLNCNFSYLQTLSDSAVIENLPCFFTIRNAFEGEETSLVTRLSFKNIKWFYDNKPINLPYEVHEVVNTWVFRFIPLSKGKYTMTADVEVIGREKKPIYYHTYERDFIVK